MFLVQINKKTRDVVNIGVYDQSTGTYIDDVGSIDSKFQTDVYDYVYLSYRDMRVNLNCCDFLKGGIK